MISLDPPAARHRFAGAEVCSRAFQGPLNRLYAGVRTSEDAPRNPCSVLVHRHGLAEFVERRDGVIHQSPKLLPQIFHHSEQQTFPLSVMYGDRSYAMVVESACFEGKRRRDPARCPANYSAYVAGLGVDARDRRRHPWQARAAILGTR